MAPIDSPHFAGTPSLNQESSGASATKPVFDVENLSIAFGDRVVLRNVSIRIPTGVVTAIIGPSGCGKSTFLRALNRMHDLVLTARVTGKVLLLGQDIYAPGTDSVLLRRRVGMVFQKSTLFPSMSIRENVTIGLKLHGIRQKSVLEERLEKALRSASLWDEVKDRLNTHAVSLSGGQQQRLCIARTLAIQPDVLLMDEPTSALDPIATAKIEELILDLKKEVSVVIVTHNMQQASRVSDLTAFFHMGDLIEFDATPAIFTHPRQQKTEDYISGRFG